MLLSNQNQIENFLEDVWNILDHPDVNVRMAAGEALKGILLLLQDREVRHRLKVVRQIFKRIQKKLPVDFYKKTLFNYELVPPNIDGTLSSGINILSSS